MAQQATYAVNEKGGRGRKFPEKAHPYRSDFERDRDRIIHSQAFRRLEGKTQVFTPGLDDSYRNRLTHSIEVSQIARTISRVLGLNENLTEAISLAHDLGHPPFGHTGEKVLDKIMKDFGGFEHNHQTLRIVELLEHPYSAFAGLNLMYETRLALAKHRSAYDKPEDNDFEEPVCSLEGQIADISDRIAYNCHDLEDGLKAELIKTELITKVRLFSEAQEKINASAIEDQSTQRTRTAKTIIDTLVSDCIETSKKAIKNANVQTINDVHSYGKNLITISEENERRLTELEKFLMENFYLNPTLVKTLKPVEDWLGTLFDRFRSKPELLPEYYQQLSEDQGIERTVCDYIAGMTDRYCLKMIDE